MLFEPHPAFKFNGKSFSIEGLKELGYSLVKEGRPYEQAIGDFLLDWFDPRSFIEAKTSGSTGIPKTIILEKRHMINSARATGKFFGLQPGDTALLCLPCNFIAGKMMWVRAMVLGLEMDDVEPTSNPMGGLEKQYGFCAMVPLQVQNSLSKLNQVRTLIVGGAPLSPRTKSEIRHIQTAIYETYGMTETITHIAVKSINHPKEPYFKTLPNVSVSKDDRECLVITAPTISEQPVITNDLVNLVSDTEFEWLGRFDHIINSGGIKLIPETIETKLTKLLDLRFFVTGMPDELLGHKLVLIIEGEIDKEVLLKKIKSDPTIEKYEVPKEIYSLPIFVETRNGKILREETKLAIRPY